LLEPSAQRAVEVEAHRSPQEPEQQAAKLPELERLGAARVLERQREQQWEPEWAANLGVANLGVALKPAAGELVWVWSEVWARSPLAGLEQRSLDPLTGQWAL
jgi:hypothetical protein